MLSGTDLERGDLAAIVRKVMERYIRSRERRQGEKVLVIFTDWISGFDDTMDYCDDSFDPKMTDYLLEKTYPGVNRLGTVFHVGKEDDERLLMDQIASYARLVVFSPTIRTLRAVASGVPTTFADRAMLKAILHRTKVLFRMDFNPSELPTGRFSTELRKLIEDVADMGVRFEFGLPDDGKAEDTGTVLITAETVDEYNKQNRKVIRTAAKTIVTPLARERADELHIKILTQEIL